MQCGRGAYPRGSHLWAYLANSTKQHIVANGAVLRLADDVAEVDPQSVGLALEVLREVYDVLLEGVGRACSGGKLL